MDLFETATCAETHKRAIGRRWAVGGRATFGGLWDSAAGAILTLVDLVFVLLAGDEEGLRTSAAVDGGGKVSSRAKVLVRRAG